MTEITTDQLIDAEARVGLVAVMPGDVRLRMLKTPDEPLPRGYVRPTVSQYIEWKWAACKMVRDRTDPLSRRHAKREREYIERRRAEGLVVEPIFKTLNADLQAEYEAQA